MDKAIKFFGVCVVIASLVIGATVYLSVQTISTNIDSSNTALATRIESSNTTLATNIDSSNTTLAAALQADSQADRYLFIKRDDSNSFFKETHVFDKQTGNYYIHVRNTNDEDFTNVYDLLDGRVYTIFE